MSILIKNGMVFDEEKGFVKKNILIENSIISDFPQTDAEAGEIINADGLYVFPGLIDVHVHLRQPGHEYKETIETGSLAAAKGGFTDICCMPNTNPVNDSAAVTSLIINEANKYGHCNVHPVAALTKGLGGHEISEYGELKENGAVALSDDGVPVSDSGVMRRALEYAKGFDLPVICHSEEKSLSGNGVMNEGKVSTRLGLTGIPDIAESLGIKRDIDLAELTGYKVHIAHVSCEKSVEIIREAKKRGVNVTAETAPHYFTLTEDCVEEFEGYAKMNPPLRTRKDLDAVINGIKDGTLDVIATDHAPHSDEEKIVPFEAAAFGIIGLETSLALTLDLVKEGFITMEDAARLMSINPGKVIGKSNSITKGNRANLTIVNPGFEWTPVKENFVSKSKNSPFIGRKLKGICDYTIKDGKFTWRRL